jgi:DNA repair exonuclease SbcCD ATPase subunit
MTIAKLKDQLAGKLKDQLASKLKREDPPGPDERDAMIEKLERAIAEERDHSATLRKTIDELHFKAETLERGYSTQLEAARRRCETAERELGEARARLAEFEGAGKNATQLLDEARVELAQVTAERDRLRKALSSPGGTKVAVTAPGPAGSQPQADQMSIDELMEDAIWAHEQEKINRERRGVDPQPSTDLESIDEVLIPPELVFASKPDEDE